MNTGTNRDNGDNNNKDVGDCRKTDKDGARPVDRVDRVDWCCGNRTKK